MTELTKGVGFLEVKKLLSYMGGTGRGTNGDKRQATIIIG